MPFILQQSLCTSTHNSRKSLASRPPHLQIPESSSPSMPFLQNFRSKMGRKHSPDSAATGESYFISTAPATRRPDRPGMNAFSTPSNEPPPSYQDATTLPSYSAATATTTANTTATTARAQAVPGDDDEYAFLSQFDTVFLIDDSGSMAGRSWRECSMSLRGIAPICTAHDTDGVDIYFLNAPDSPAHMGVKDAATISEIFSSVQPGGGTPTGQRLHRIMKRYIDRLARASDNEYIKPLNIIVITDGAPADDVESVLVRAAKRLDELDAAPWQLGIQFVQVGEEPAATAHLRSLDDELTELGAGCRDIVDTVPCNSGRPLTHQTILKVVLGAVNKRLDRRRLSSSS